MTVVLAMGLGCFQMSTPLSRQFISLASRWSFETGAFRRIGSTERL